MAFLLGSLTSGLFGGMADAANMVNAWEGLKQKRMETQQLQRQQDAADAAMKADAETTARQALNTGAAPATGASAAGTGPTPLHPNSGRDSSGRPDITSMPLPKFMQPNNKPAVLLAGGANPFQRGSREVGPAGGVGSFGRGSREGEPALADTSEPTYTGASAAIPPAPVNTGASAVIPPAPSASAAIPPAPSASAALPVPRTVAPHYLPAGAAQAPIPPRSAIGTSPTGYAGVAGQPGTPSGPQAAAPPGAAPSLGQQQTPSLGMQIFNAINNSASGF
jgi:hypothetical protein